MEGLLIEVQRVHDFKCPNSAQLELLYECNYMGMAHHCRYTPKPQKMAANTGKTALGICQTKVVKYNLGVKSHQYHKCQASGTVSPGFSAVLQITDSSMTCCKHLQTYLSTAATPKVAVLVGLQRIVPWTPCTCCKGCPLLIRNGDECWVSFALALPFYTNLCKAMRARTASWDGEQQLKKGTLHTYSTLLGLHLHNSNPLSPALFLQVCPIYHSF